MGMGSPFPICLWVVIQDTVLLADVASSEQQVRMRLASLSQPQRQPGQELSVQHHFPCREHEEIFWLWGPGTQTARRSQHSQSGSASSLAAEVESGLTSADAPASVSQLPLAGLGFAKTKQRSHYGSGSFELTGGYKRGRISS